MTSLVEIYSEHRSARQNLVLLEEAALRLSGQRGQERPGQVWKEPAFQVSLYFRSFLLPHFDVEEKVIFPYLEFPRGRKVRDELLKEHEILRADIDRFLTLLEGEAKPQTLMTLGLELGTLLVRHANKEDEILVPLIRERLGIGDNEPIPHAPSMLYREG